MRPKGYHESQIWWCSIGENIGVESDGKGKDFLRPVLIIKKFGYSAFLGVPLTSKAKANKPFYYEISIGKRKSLLMFSQIRTWDSSRLVRKVTDIDGESFLYIKDALYVYLGMK